jgi:predicted small lipoprotein YifL
MKKRYIIFIFLLAAAVSMTACAKKRPVLYPNATYQAMGKTASEADIDYCIQLAADHAPHQLQKVLQLALRSAVPPVRSPAVRVADWPSEQPAGAPVVSHAVP